MVKLVETDKNLSSRDGQVDGVVENHGLLGYGEEKKDIHGGDWLDRVGAIELERREYEVGLVLRKEELGSDI